MQRVLDFLTRPAILAALIWVNGLGTIYGYYWYKNQLLTTPAIFWPVVPDSPTASLFLTIFLYLLWKDKRNPYIESFGAVYAIKYGLWAPGVIFFFGYLEGQIEWANWMLVASHLGMAVEVFLFSRFFTFKTRHLVVAGVWILFNDLIDYTFDVHPWLQSDDYDTPIGWLTVLLSIAVIATVALLRKQQTVSVKGEW